MELNVSTFIGITIILLCGAYLTKATPIERDEIYENLGRNQCLNIKGKYETCGYLQFCSDSELDKGCRNCSEIYMHWCDYLEQFRRRYPSCEVLCERAQIQKLQEDNDNLNEENERLKWAFGGVVTVLVLITILLFRYILNFHQQNATTAAVRNGTCQQSTATVNRSCIWKWLECICCLSKKESRPVTAEQTAMLSDSNTKEETSKPTISFPHETSVTQPADGDSGQGSESSSSVTNGSNNSLRVPTGGTEHQPQDANDFMINMADLPEGANATETI